MSCELAVWHPDRLISDEEALNHDNALCDEDNSGLISHPSIGNFYLELYKIHPEKVWNK